MKNSARYVPLNTMPEMTRWNEHVSVSFQLRRYQCVLFAQRVPCVSQCKKRNEFLCETQMPSIEIGNG